jgi:uncharacterized membrane protein
MSELIVIAFKDLQGAKSMESKVLEMQKAQLLTVEDAAIVTRDIGGKAKVEQLNSLTGAGAVGGGFWGMLIGLLFLAPWLGLAVGAITGALAGKHTDIGIDDTFIKKVSETIKPGQSALFLLAGNARLDRVTDELKPFHGEIIHTSLSKENEAKLKASFGAN